MLSNSLTGAELAEDILRNPSRPGLFACCEAAPAYATPMHRIKSAAIRTHLCRFKSKIRQIARFKRTKDTLVQRDVFPGVLVVEERGSFLKLITTVISEASDLDPAVDYNAVPAPKPTIVVRSFATNIDRKPARTTTTRTACFDCSLGSHAWGSFKQRARPEMWLADRLPAEWTCTRIILYGYDSQIVGSESRQDLADIAKDFNNSLVDMRKSLSLTEKCVPIVFIAHSLGGLVLKQALAFLSKQATYPAAEPNIQSTFRDVYAMLFFGVPCKGLDGEQLGLAAMARGQANQGFLSDLRNDSSLVKNLADIFLGVFERRPVQIYSFYETHESATAQMSWGRPSMSGPKKHWVGKDAAFNGRDAERKRDETFSIPMSTDHSGLVKCNDTQSYEKIKRVLLSFDWQRTSREIEEYARDSKVPLDLLQELDFPKRRGRERQIANTEKFDETFEWIWNSPFNTWLSAPMVNNALESQVERPPKSEELSSELADGDALDSMNPFWICGKAASGKSTMINYLSDCERTTNILQDRHGKNCVIIRFFFDFRQRIELSNSFDGLLLSFLYCAVEQAPELARQPPRSELASWKNEGKYKELPTSELRKIVQTSLTKIALKQVVCVFVDGVDEYEGDMIDLGIFLRNLSRLPGLKLCIASRPDPVLARQFPGAQRFEMQEYNLQGLEAFATLTLQRKAGSLLSNHDTNLHTQNAHRLKLTAKAVARRVEGVFLWASWAMKELPMAWVKLESIGENHGYTDMMSCLDRMPSELEAIWERMFERLDPDTRNEALTVLQLVCFSCEELELLGLIRALQITLGAQIYSVNMNRTVPNLGDRIVSITAGLLELGTSWRTGHAVTVKLSHKTVRTFLEKTLLKHDNQKMFNPYLMWLKVCVSVLKDSAYETRSLGSGRNYPDTMICFSCGSHTGLVNDKRTSSPALVDYAITYFASHAKDLEERRNQSSLPYLEHILSADLLRIHGDLRLSDEPNALVRQTMFALAHGLRLFFEDLVSKSPLTICPDGDKTDESTDCLNTNPLLDCALGFTLIHHIITRGNSTEDGSDVKLIETVLDHFPAISDGNMIFSIGHCTVQVVKILLQRRGTTRRTVVYDPSKADAPWDPQVLIGRLCAVALKATVDIEAKIDMCLELGDDIDEEWGLNMTAMHAAYLRDESIFSSKYVGSLLQARGSKFNGEKLREVIEWAAPIRKERDAKNLLAVRQARMARVRKTQP
ncbi:hypothetical protein VTL71DRAFT_6769 [Oculimacula yallundae]|uniref:Nephrocystin 3-like N-terminal domain-containing protein n=1 Tax=Oculimacula yallundae TaxID=86028 RepID=A0ABR4BXY9_9HELO